jgi:hypothetical protein
MAEKLRKEAGERTESRAPSAIEKRFSDTSSLVNDTVSGMCGKGLKFPNALLNAVKGKSPGLGAKIAGILGAIRK